MWTGKYGGNIRFRWEKKMSKFKEYDVEEIDALCSLGRALSSPIRIEIMQLLYEEGMIIGDIAKKLDLPASSTAFHLKILEEAGLIRMEKQPGTRGTVNSLYSEGGLHHGQPDQKKCGY